jgi:hypothetical protein
MSRLQKRRALKCAERIGKTKTGGTEEEVAVTKRKKRPETMRGKRGERGEKELKNDGMGQ